MKSTDPKLRLRVTNTGNKSFIVGKKVSGKYRRVTLGRWPDLEITTARELAQKALGEMAGGADIAQERRQEREEKKRDKLKDTTLAQLFASYCATKTWNPNTRKSTVIKPQQLAPWYRAVTALPDDNHDGTQHVRGTIRDALLLMLFSGLRREEVLQLEWERTDLTERTITLLDPKNCKPFTCPLNSEALAILEGRHGNSGKDARWVFPGRMEDKPIHNPMTIVDLIEREASVRATPHDLRRTFATAAEAANEPHVALKRLLNHATDTDVTAGYVRTDPETLRGFSQRIADYLMALARENAGGKVTPIREAL